MSDYHLVSTLHAARVELADARKAVVAAEAKVAAADAAVNAALATGRVASSKHLLDLDFDCLGAILSHLGPKDALSTARTCTTLRAALFRGGLPWPLAGVCHKPWHYNVTAATKEAALRALDAMQPALGALRLKFRFSVFDEGHARVLARALDKAPRATRIDIDLYSASADDAGRLADVLTSPDRAFAAPPQVHIDESGELLPLTRAGICVASVQENMEEDEHITEDVLSAASTLTHLFISVSVSFNLPTQFPALRRLTLDIDYPESLTANVPSLTALAPHLKEIVLDSSFDEDREEPHDAGFGFEPTLFARFVAAIQGVTRVSFGPRLMVTLSQNENESLRHLTDLRTLRDLEISIAHTNVALGPRPSSPGPPRAPVAEEVITNLPPLPPGLTRLAFSSMMRVAFGHPLPGLRVLDWRGSSPGVFYSSFYVGDEHRELGENVLSVPLAIPSAAVAPNLCTLLIGYIGSGGAFDLYTLVAARTALRVVVIERARLLCNVPGGFKMTTAGFAAGLAREAPKLVSVHTHGCEIEGGHQSAVENFLRAVEQRGGRVCRDNIWACMFCIMHDGTDIWW